MVKHFLAVAIVAVTVGLSACSGTSNGPPPPFIVNPTPSASITPRPSATPSAGPSAVPSPTASPSTGASPMPSPSPASSGSPGIPTATPAPGTTATPVLGATSTPSPSPTPVATVAPSIVGDLTSIYVCDEVQMSCPNDLDPNASSGEEAVVLVKGVLGALTVSNAGGGSTATLTTQVYASMGSATEYAVSYKSAIDAPTSDTLTISDAGSHSSLTIPVTIVAAGNDSGASAFVLTQGSGTVCPGNAITFGTSSQGNAPIAMTASNPALINVSTSQGAGNFVDYLVGAGSSYVTASAGSSSIIYPANVPSTGFTTSC